MSVENALSILNAAVSRLQELGQSRTDNAPTRSTARNRPNERSQRLAPLHQQIQSVFKAADANLVPGSLTPEQLSKIDELEAAIKTTLQCFGTQSSGGAFKDTKQAASKDIVTDAENVLLLIQQLLHADMSEAEVARKLLVGDERNDGIAQIAADNAKIFERKIAGAESGNLKLLHWFFNVFKADLRFKDKSYTDKDGNKKYLLTVEDLVNIKDGDERQKKMFRSLFAQARGRVKDSPGKFYPVTGDIKLSDYPEDSRDLRDQFGRGKSVQDYKDMEYPRNARTANTSRLTVKKK